MSKALEARPVEDFIAPEGVVFTKIDTGKGSPGQLIFKKDGISGL